MVGKQDTEEAKIERAEGGEHAVIMEGVDKLREDLGSRASCAALVRSAAVKHYGEGQMECLDNS